MEDQGKLITLERKSEIDKDGLAKRAVMSGALDRDINHYIDQRNEINQSIKAKRKRLSEILQESSNKVENVKTEFRAFANFDKKTVKLLNPETGKFVETVPLDDDMKEHFQQMEIDTEKAPKKTRGKRGKAMELNTADHADMDAQAEFAS